MFVRHLRLLGPAIALLLLVATVARADNEKLAKHLHKLNPAALVGGKSIVGTKPKQELHGSHGKPNFIVALADGETIHGSSTNDELGVGPHAQDVKIIAPGSGHSLIVGGPGSTIIARGKGHNLIVSHGKGATIILESPGDEVIATGPHDRIICAEHSSHELIKVDEDVNVSKRCHGHGDRIKRLGAGPSAASASATAHSSAIFGSGTNADPFVGNCDGDTLFKPVCITTFPARTLDFFWDHEYVPAYECVGSHHWLLDQDFAPSGTTLPPGVEIRGLGPIGVSITGTKVDMPDFSKAQGTLTGFDNSSATNWKIPSGPASYQVILHCVDDPARGYVDY